MRAGVEVTFDKAALIEPATGLRVALAERLAQATQADST